MRILLTAADAGDVRALTRDLAARGNEVAVVAGSPERSAGEIETHSARDGAVRVHRLMRPDLHPDHWHKARSPAVTAAFRTLVRAARPDLVHVHHWRRLSSDLVLAAAREGVPAVVSLNDFWTSCPLATRVRPDSGADCDSPAGPHPCVACAAHATPRTPWVETGQGFVALAERQNEIARELTLARAVLAPGEAGARAQQAYLERQLEVAGTTDELEAVYRRAVEAGPPAPAELPAETWFEDRMRAFAIEQWDDACGQAD